LNATDVAIFVEIGEQTLPLADLMMDLIPPDMMDWSVGGITDPIGQLINWLWTQIQSAFSIVSTALQGALWTVRDYLYSAFQTAIGGITSVIGSISSTLGYVYTAVQSIPQALSSLVSTITSAITGIGVSIASFGSVLGNIWSALQGIASQVVSGVSGFFSTIQSWLSSAIATVSTSISGLASTFTSYISTFATRITELGTAISGMASSIISSISSAIQGVATSLSSSFQGIQTFFSNFAQTFAATLTGISTTLSSVGSQLWEGVLGLKDWLVDGVKSISMNLTQIWMGLEQWITQLPQWFQSTWNNITEGLTRFGNTLTGFWQNVQGFFTNAYNSLTSSVKEVMTTLGGFVNPLINIGNLFNQFVQGVMGFFKDPWGTLGKVLTDALKAVGIDITPLAKAIQDLQVGFTNFLKDPWTALGKVLTDALKSIGIDLTPLTKFLGDVKAGVANFFGEFPKLFQGFVTWLTKDLPKWLTEDVPKWFQEVGKGTEEWLKGLDVSWVNKVFEGVASFIKDPMKSIGDAFKGIIEWGQNTLFPAIQSGIKGIMDVLTNIGKNIWDGILSFFQTGFEWMASGVKGLLSFFTPKSPSVLDDISKFFADLLGKIFFKPFAAIPTLVFQRTKAGDLPKETPMEATVAYMGGLMLQAVSFPYLLSAVMRTAGDSIKVAGELGIPKATCKIDIKPGLLLKHLAKVIWKLPDVFLGSLGYGFGIWMTQPLLRVINSFKRNEMPIEMPNLQELREITNRASTIEVFEEVQSSVAQFMAYYGYSDWSVAWNLGFYNELGEIVMTDPFTTVKDRFGNIVEVPLALRHKLPSGSEFATMMVRDVFSTFEDFSEVMAVQGYGPDVSKLYYLLHYKYPPMDQLWRFIARVSAGFGWAEGTFEKPAKLGFDGATPKELSAKYGANPIQSLVALSEKILPYAKWHDYAPFAWMQDFTSDRLIMLDLMARLPDRIEGRWMYKWSIIDDAGLQKLVVAEGFHPNVIENVAVAEAMNALTEERSSAKTGLLNLYEAGFYALGQVNSKLQQITTVSILGKERTVKLLDGERKLEVLRSGYDRAKSVLSGLWRDITTAFSANLYPPQEAMQIVQDMTTKLKITLGLDLSVDEAFLSVWLETHAVRWKQQTIQRIRSLMRVFIYRASQLAEAGEDVGTLIDRFAQVAYLTPVEAEIMKTLALAFVKASQKSKGIALIKQSVAARLRRGEISFEVAVQELVNAGMTDAEARVWLDTQGRTRTVSVDKLITMMEDIPIDLETLKKKMDAEGVPLDEQKLYLPFAVSQEIKEEIAKVVTEYLDDYVEHVIDEPTLKAYMDSLATLNGTVKEKLGVEWIVLSPTEREYLIYLARLRRARRDLPASKMKTLSSDKLISMSDNVPVATSKIIQKMGLEGIPEDEQKLMIPFALATEISAEMGRVVTELITDHATGVLSIEAFNKAIDDLATLGGAVPALLGVEWIVLSPLERALFTNLAKLRRARVLAKQAGVK